MTLDYQQIVETILKYSLSTRRIPLVVESHCLMPLKSIRDTDDVVERLVSTGCPEKYAHLKANNSPLGGFRFDEETYSVYRYVVRKVHTPTHAGYWMVQPTPHTSTQVHWNKETCFLAPTLGESIALFLKSRQPSHD